MDDIYIVNKNRSLVTKKGVIKPGEEADRKLIGKNFDKLVDMGWLIKKEELIIKPNEDINVIKENVIEEKKEGVKEPVKDEAKSLSKKELKAQRKISMFGAKKATETVEAVQEEKAPEIPTDEEIEQPEVDE